MLVILGSRERPRAASSHLEDDRRMAEELQRIEEMKIIEAKVRCISQSLYHGLQFH